jgi:hypothetical protein
VLVLPSVVEVGLNGYFQHQGHQYFYDHDRWYYSDSRNAPRHELPRFHWLKETRRKPE